MTLMNAFLARILVTLALMAGVFPGPAVAETTAPAEEAEPPPTAVSTDFDSLVGLWVRPDGGYMVAIRGVEANGKLSINLENSLLGDHVALDSDLVVLAVGIVPLVYWFSGLAGGPEAYASAYALLSSVPVQILLFAWVLSFSYHLLNGIRHLLWDAGWGFEIQQVVTSGWAVVAGSVVVTLIVWFLLGGAA
mgnify:CR=1 FL=1